MVSENLDNPLISDQNRSFPIIFAFCPWELRATPCWDPACGSGLFFYVFRLEMCHEACKGASVSNFGDGLARRLGAEDSGPAPAFVGATGVWIPAFAGNTVGGAGITIGGAGLCRREGWAVVEGRVPNQPLRFAGGAVYFGQWILASAFAGSGDSGGIGGGVRGEMDRCGNAACFQVGGSV